MLIHYGVPLLIFALVLLIGWLMTKMFIFRIIEPFIYRNDKIVEFLDLNIIISNMH